jgi:Fe-Mn family superoxide dismutase
MKMHFKLYEGLVAATNKANDLLQKAAISGVADPVAYSAIQKEFSLFFNGMRLHELYFEQLGSGSGRMSDGLADAINSNFGSFDVWRTNFMQTGEIPGVGFVVLLCDDATGRLMNRWINEFNVGELLGTHPLLVMDVWEHAYITQFGLDTKKYMTVFLDNVNWDVVSRRWEHPCSLRAKV